MHQAVEQTDVKDLGSMKPGDIQQLMKRYYAPTDVIDWGNAVLERYPQGTAIQFDEFGEVIESLMRGVAISLESASWVSRIMEENEHLMKENEALAKALRIRGRGTYGTG